MKPLIALLVLAASSSVFAAADLKKEIWRQTFTIEVAVTNDSVRCSAIGYGLPELKIDVPALDWAAKFQHRNLGEGQPCMTAGRCTSFRGPELVLQDRPGVEAVDLTVIHSEEGVIDRERDTCHRRLVEEVEMTLRGTRFTHTRTAPLIHVSAEECERALK